MAGRPDPLRPADRSRFRSPFPVNRPGCMFARRRCSHLFGAPLRYGLCVVFLPRRGSSPDDIRDQYRRRCRKSDRKESWP